MWIRCIALIIHWSEATKMLNNHTMSCNCINVMQTSIWTENGGNDENYYPKTLSHTILPQYRLGVILSRLRLLGWLQKKKKKRGCGQYAIVAWRLKNMADDRPIILISFAWISDYCCVQCTTLLSWLKGILFPRISDYCCIVYDLVKGTGIKFAAIFELCFA